MLKPRVYTALVLLPLIIASIFFLPPIFFFILATLVILGAGWEWTKLAEISQLYKKIIYVALLCLILMMTIFLPIDWIVLIGILWWLTALILLLFYPKGTSWWGKSTVIRGVMGYLVLALCWISLIILQGYSPALLLFALALIWSVDIAAYVGGKTLGKHKLAVFISPGKTYEGFIAGLIAALLIGLIGFGLFDVPVSKWWLFLFICLFGGGVLTVLGDLFESMLKRQSHLKDSGQLLPGHGGLLDRIDSITSALPFFTLIFPYFFN
jgi:phosphatidate cytidylyltransferase